MLLSLTKKKKGKKQDLKIFLSFFKADRKGDKKRKSFKPRLKLK